LKGFLGQLKRYFNQVYEIIYYSYFFAFEKAKILRMNLIDQEWNAFCREVG